jgi:sulfite reductase (NADPH) flavoprotein alpha-component
MSVAPRIAIPQLIPENAPFSPEQRTWLNGFFAGLISIEGSAVTALTPAESAALMPQLPPDEKTPPGDGDDGEAPWHDQSLPIGERMKLAENRPLRRRMMAAMAQQDCGQCGYDCNNYSEALFLRKEARLNLCVPGGKETARMLRALYAELDSAPQTAVRVAPVAAGAAQAPAVEPSPAPIRPGCSRDHPATAQLRSRTRLNKPGSQKETWHVEIDLAESGIDYAVGDSLGVCPSNDPGLVDAVIVALGVSSDFPTAGRTLREVLLDSVSLAPAPDMLFQLYSYISGGERRRKAKALGAGDDPDGDAGTLDVLAAMQKFRGLQPDPEAFIEALDPLQPRLYSIASSPRVDPRRVGLCVDAVRYCIDKRARLGVASTYLIDRAGIGGRLKVYVQKAHHFALPSDPTVPIIMIGPGTGIAPFRAFLHERMAAQAPGRNWLFFGHQHRATDFFYEDELAGLKAKRVLTRLTLAWSRDGDQKIYVQDRMRDVGRDLWSWIADGACVYVCGDGKRMAKDVERALIDVVASFGARSVNEAISFVADLKKQGRYQQDVY